VSGGFEFEAQSIDIEVLIEVKVTHGNGDMIDVEYSGF
jgi:hypothetical protein